LILDALADRIELAAISAEVDRLASEIPEHDLRGRWHRCSGDEDVGRKPGTPDPTVS